MPPQKDLATLLRYMTPELSPDEYVFCNVPPAVPAIPGINAFATIEEAEGRTLITTRDDAEQVGLPYAYPCRHITLRVHSSLDAVGFLAHIAAELARHGISANCISAYVHDHLFVPIPQAEEALAVLQAIQNAPQSEIQPVTLTGRRVELRPLSWDHFNAVAQLASDESIWRWYTHPFHTPELMRAAFIAVLDEQARGVSLPFVTFDLVSGRLAGGTRFLNIDRTNRRAEIGFTWLAPEFQRSHINTEAKYLMLRHAFETWGYNRVEFKTDSFNERSRTAIARIGAKEEGTFRNHLVTATPRLRHSVYFSIIAEEWPAVKAGLEAKMRA